MIALKSVDLPLPLTPTSAQIVPGSKLERRVAHGDEAVGVGDGHVVHRDAGAGRTVDVHAGCMPAAATMFTLPKPFTMVSALYFSRSRYVGAGPFGGAERIDVEHAAVARAGFARHLLGGLSLIVLSLNTTGNLVLPHEVDDLPDLLRRALLVGVDRPEKQLPSCRSRAMR